MATTTEELQYYLRRNSEYLNALDYQTGGLLQERAEICYSLKIARNGQSSPIWTPPKPSKTQTCSVWANHPSGCLKSSAECQYAHNFFSTIVWRAHHGGEQLGECRHFPRCTWPAEVCGFAHGKDGKRAKEDMKQYASSLPYRVVCVMQCKACGKPLATTEEAEVHYGPVGGCFARLETGSDGESDDLEGVEQEMRRASAHKAVMADVEMEEAEEGEIEG